MCRKFCICFSYEAPNLLYDDLIIIKWGYTYEKNLTILFIIFFICFGIYFIITQYAKHSLDSGIAKYDINNYTGAIEDYNKAIQFNPNYAKAYYNRGNAEVHLEDLTGAIQL